MTRDFEPSRWITTKEAAELTGYAAAYFRQLIGRGRLQAHKIGRDWVLEKSEVLEYAEKMKRLGPEKYNPWRTGARETETSEEDDPAQRSHKDAKRLTYY
jgi:excisionase family DNA binding protein